MRMKKKKKRKMRTETKMKVKPGVMMMIIIVIFSSSIIIMTIIILSTIIIIPILVLIIIIFIISIIIMAVLMNTNNEDGTNMPCNSQHHNGNKDDDEDEGGIYQKKAEGKNIKKDLQKTEARPDLGCRGSATHQELGQGSTAPGGQESGLFSRNSGLRSGCRLKRQGPNQLWFLDRAYIHSRSLGRTPFDDVKPKFTKA